MSSNTESNGAGITSTTDWETRFPYPAPYDDQKEAIQKTKAVADDDGFTVTEAACGTGKTLISLMAGIDLVRDPDSKYDRVMVLTSVKQQLKQFEEDLQKVNANLPSDEPPVRGLTLVGKADLCSYVDAGKVDRGDIYSKCEDLRDTVKNRMANAGGEQETIGVLTNMVDEMDIGTDATGNLRDPDGDWESPYDSVHPDDAGNFCAFYANYRLKQKKDESVLSFDGMMTPDDVMAQASRNGICPHAAMGTAIDDAEVIVANYYHAFDPMTTEALTGGLIDDSTFLVCDEAHMLEPRVRDLLSDSIAYQTLNMAINEIENEVLNPNNSEAQSYIKQRLRDNAIDPNDVTEFRNFLEQIKDKMEDLAVKALDSEDEDWEENVLDMGDVTFPLRDPETIETDDLTDWADLAGARGVWEDAWKVGQGIADALEYAAENTDYQRLETYCDTAGRVLGRWIECDHETYFRTFEMKKREYEYEGADYFWNQHFRPHLTMHNCIPSERIADTLDQFGGGILMSATLAPLDVYKETVGLSELDRPVKELSYGLDFPTENRESLAVNATKFTRDNRGSPYEDTPTREQYLEVITSVVENTDGNVLIGMPSYSEAEWVEYKLNQDWDWEVDKPVRADESSTNAATQELKEWFFSGGPKVLATSLRGTLTEGVDYDGDRLDAAVVCGVPIRSLAGPYPDAIRTAYEAEFGNNGFEYAFTVPAVRKARQALGRVIRGDDDKGIRVIADERYATHKGWDSVRDYFPSYAQDEYTAVDSGAVESKTEVFWRQH